MAAELQNCMVAAIEQSTLAVPRDMHGVLSCKGWISAAEQSRWAVTREMHGALSHKTHLQLGRQQLEDVVDLVLEPARKHLVSLVQHKHPDGVSPQSAAAQHVVDAPGRAHNHVHSSLEDAGVLAHTGSTHTGVALDLWSMLNGQHIYCAALSWGPPRRLTSRLQGRYLPDDCTR